MHHPLRSAILSPLKFQISSFNSPPPVPSAYLHLLCLPLRSLPFFFAAAALAPLTARADVINVYVFSFDFSINQPGEPIVDAVINVGDIVQWVAIDEFHDTVAASGQAEFWQSHLFQIPGDVFDYQFTIPGIYEYYCSPHGGEDKHGHVEGMSGTITVLPAPGASVLVLGAALAIAPRRRRPPPRLRASA